MKVAKYVLYKIPTAWVLNKIKPIFQEKTDWVGDTNGEGYVEESPCCEKIIWNQANSPERMFTMTENQNEHYPVYETDIDGQTISMWWMWHGNVGHWVVNDSQDVKNYIC